MIVSSMKRLPSDSALHRLITLLSSLMIRLQHFMLITVIHFALQNEKLFHEKKSQAHEMSESNFFIFLSSTPFIFADFAPILMRRGF